MSAPAAGPGRGRPWTPGVTLANPQEFASRVRRPRTAPGGPALAPFAGMECCPASLDSFMKTRTPIRFSIPGEKDRLTGLARRLGRNDPWPGTVSFLGMLATFTRLRRLSRSRGLVRLGAVASAVEGALYDLSAGRRQPGPELLALLRDGVEVAEAILANVAVFGMEGAVPYRQLVSNLAPRRPRRGDPPPAG